MKERGSAKLPAMIILLLLGGGGLLYVTYRAANRATVKKQTQAEEPKKEGPMTEEERLAYLEQFVVVEDLKLGQDKMPDRDEPVPGLFRVTGLVRNKGERLIERVNLAIYPKDAEGKVLGSYIENIVGAGGLPAGAAREFKFQIPEKREYGGTFDHELR